MYQDSETTKPEHTNKHDGRLQRLVSEGQGDFYAARRVHVEVVARKDEPERATIGAAAGRAVRESRRGYDTPPTTAPCEKSFRHRDTKKTQTLT